MIVKLNEGALFAAGLPRDFIETMRHLVRQAGTLTLETTLPEVVSTTDALGPVVSNLQITLIATNATVAELVADQGDAPYTDKHLAQRLDQLQADAERADIDNGRLMRALGEMRAEMGRSRADAAKEIAMLRDEIADLPAREHLNAMAKRDGSASQLFAASSLKISAGNAPIVPLSVSASTAATGIQLRGRTSDDLGFIEFFRADGTTLEGSIYGGVGKLALTGPAGTDALTLTTAGVKVVTAFGANGATPQTALALGAAATDLPTVITLANNLRTMAINNGMGS